MELTYSFQADYIEANYPMIDLSVCVHMSIHGIYVVYVCVCVSERGREIQQLRKGITSIFEAF